MKKNRIRLTESQLQQVIMESVKRALNEGAVDKNALSETKNELLNAYYQIGSLASTADGELEVGLRKCISIMVELFRQIDIVQNHLDLH